MSAAVAAISALSATPDRFLRILNHLRRFGLWAFPLRITPDGQKLPLVKWKELQDRPPTASEIEQWLCEFSDAGAAIPTGPATNKLVVDTDSSEAIEWVELRGMPETVLVRSPRGLHYYLEFPTGIEVHNSAGEIAPGVDIRARGGMIVAAGTQRPDGFVYRYDEGHALGQLPIAAAPEWLVDRLRELEEAKVPPAAPTTPRQYTGRTSAWARRAFDANLEALAAAAPGTRNTACWDAARRLGQLCAGGELLESEVLTGLFQIVCSWPNAGRSRDTIRRAFAAGALTPRRRPDRSLALVDPYSPVGAMA